jgi:hypothetical protein
MFWLFRFSVAQDVPVRQRSIKRMCFMTVTEKEIENKYNNEKRNIIIFSEQHKMTAQPYNL